MAAKWREWLKVIFRMTAAGALALVSGCTALPPVSCIPVSDESLLLEADAILFAHLEKTFDDHYAGSARRATETARAVLCGDMLFVTRTPSAGVVGSDLTVRLDMKRKRVVALDVLP